MKYTTLKSSKRVVQYYGYKKAGHYARSCPKLYCSFCKIKGHTVDKCRKKGTSKIIVVSKLTVPRVLPEVIMIHLHSGLYRGINILTTQDCLLTLALRHILCVIKISSSSSMMTSGPRNMLLNLLMAQIPMQPRTEEPLVLASRMQLVGCFQLNSRTLCTY